MSGSGGLRIHPTHRSRTSFNQRDSQSLCDCRLMQWMRVLYAVSRGRGHPPEFETAEYGFVLLCNCGTPGHVPREIPTGRRADACTGCQSCIAACPQRLDIPDWLRTVSKILGGDEMPEVGELDHFTTRGPVSSKVGRRPADGSTAALRRSMLATVICPARQV